MADVPKAEGDVVVGEHVIPSTAENARCMAHSNRQMSWYILILRDTLRIGARLWSFRKGDVLSTFFASEIYLTDTFFYFNSSASSGEQSEKVMNWFVFIILEQYQL